MNKPLFYQAHPYGQNLNNTYISSVIGTELSTKGIVVLNPLIIFPFITKDEKRAIKKCKLLFNVCDALILTGEWEKSIGCLREIRWSQKQKKPIYIFRDHKFYNFENRKLLTDLEMVKILGG